MRIAPAILATLSLFIGGLAAAQSMDEQAINQCNANPTLTCLSKRVEELSKLLSAAQARTQALTVKLDETGGGYDKAIRNNERNIAIIDRQVSYLLGTTQNVAVGPTAACPGGKGAFPDGVCKPAANEPVIRDDVRYRLYAACKNNGDQDEYVGGSKGGQCCDHLPVALQQRYSVCKFQPGNWKNIPWERVIIKIKEAEMAQQ